MNAKRTLEYEINSFLQLWNAQQLNAFLKDVLPLFELFDVDDENDWVRDLVGKEDVRNVRLIRTVYLISKIAEIHSGKLSRVKAEFKDIWKRMEKEGFYERIFR